MAVEKLLHARVSAEFNPAIDIRGNKKLHLAKKFPTNHRHTQKHVYYGKYCVGGGGVCECVALFLMKAK